MLKFFWVKFWSLPENWSFPKTLRFRKNFVLQQQIDGKNHPKISSFDGGACLNFRRANPLSIEGLSISMILNRFLDDKPAKTPLFGLFS